jgi:zinc protease
MRRRLGRARALETAAERPLTALPGEITVERLANGLTVCLLENRQAPTVTCALWYRAGTRDETDGHGGTAHFLEHMMFKGSRRHGPGEIDRLTQALGGTNNAFTSYDATTYYFNFARDRWREALAIEADRMAGLTLDPGEVASERQVIQEEIAMYEADPWDALEQRVRAILFGDHPYGRPVLGTELELEATGAGELAAFHRDFYRPDNAVLVLAGDVDDGALAAAASSFGALPAGAKPRPAHPPAVFPRHLVRLERRQGEVPRVLLALPAPAAEDPDYPAARLLATLLSGGRSSRIHRRLVDEEQLCSSVSVDVTESLDAGLLAVAAELVPDSEPLRVEEELMRLLAGLTEAVPGAEELERARRILLADWVFGHERIYSQALAAGFGLALFDLEHARRQLQRMLAVEPEEIREVARRLLRPQEHGVLGWSLPPLREGGDA